MKSCTHKELRDTFEVEQQHLKDICKTFPWTNQAAYLGWLVNTYEYVQDSTRILALTGGRFAADKTAFSDRFIAHAAEEKGHERLLENDVKNFGLRIQDLEPSTFGRAFHQSFYYWIYANNPVGMFGLILALEGFAVRNVPEVYEICKNTFGSKCSSFLKVHANEDPDHLQKAFEAIQSFTEEENSIVASALHFYADLYGIVLQTTKQEALHKTSKMAA